MAAGRSRMTFKRHVWISFLTIYLLLSHKPKFHHWVGRPHHQQLTVKELICFIYYNINYMDRII